MDEKVWMNLFATANFTSWYNVLKCFVHVQLQDSIMLMTSGPWQPVRSPWNFMQVALVKTIAEQNLLKLNISSIR